jgi:AcrR family transcriptional regulator
MSARRDAEATKAAVLKAARHPLARHAHAGITLKAVAERAGVSPLLIVKYFGNKDALFTRVMSFDTEADALLDAPLSGLGRHMVRHVLAGQRERGADPLPRIAFAPLHGDHGDILRISFRAQVTERLAARLTGEPESGAPCTRAGERHPAADFGAVRSVWSGAG